MEQSEYRLKVLKRIEENEKNGVFDENVEDDPESYELKPNKIDYLNKKLSSKILEYFTIKKGGQFFENEIKQGRLIIKEVVGFENLNSIEKNTGAIVTCNHFHPFDNYIIFKSLKPKLKGEHLYKVIKEGNYTNPPKGFEMFMRHGDTLPLSSNRQTMKKFLSAIEILLKKGHKILVYPEQCMWWNYRKPRPLKNGAFSFAVTHGVPVIPMFITMEDTDKLDNDGFPLQAYTVNILSPIYPKAELNKAENIKYMKNKNYDEWVKVYESFYNKPLVYLTNDK